MKLAYLVHLNMDAKSGVFKKIYQQIYTWRKLEHDVELFVVTCMLSVAQESHKLIENSHIFLYETLFDRLEAMKKATEAVLKFNPDAVYSRRDVYYPAVAKLSRVLPLVLEINSDEAAELWRYNKVHWLYHVLTRSFLDRNVSGMIFVTNELTYKGYYGRLNLPKAVVANGITLSDFPQLPISPMSKPNLLFLGFSAFWHGIDKVVYLARQFPEWTFHMIGVTETDVFNPPPNMVLYGKLNFQDYVGIAAQCHVGIGTLALHRKGMKEASPLKVREYLAMGLPVIIGYTDTDFSGNEPFILSLPNNENNVRDNLRAIEEFVYQWMDKRVERFQIKHLDYSEKEKRRLAFIDKVRCGNGDDE